MRPAKPREQVGARKTEWNGAAREPAHVDCHEYHTMKALRCDVSGRRELVWVGNVGRTAIGGKNFLAAHQLSCGI